MKFKAGDSVKVKPGVKDPTFEVELDCCQGRVSEVYDNEVVCIDLDSHTLERMPDSQIRKCEQEGWGWHQINLDSKELELTMPRDTLDEVESIMEKISGKFAWAHLGDQGDRINGVLSGIALEDDVGAYACWKKYLSSKLIFPFKAEVIEIQMQDPLQCDDVVTVHRFSADTRLGLLVEVGFKESRYWFMLSELEVISKDSRNHEFVDDYVIWYANR